VRINRLLSMFLFALGGFLGLGATGEIVVALDPGLLPSEATQIPFMAAHQTSWALRTWMLGSNATNLICAVTLMRSALAIRRGHAGGWRQLRVATGTLGGIALVGVLVCLPFLLPLPTGPMSGPSRFMLVSVVGAGAGLATLCLVLFRFAHRAVRDAHSHQSYR
jgi:hypothetical protein